MVIGNPMIFRQLPLESALRKIKELGYDALELWPPQISECKTAALRKRLANHIRSLGLQLIRVNAASPDYFQLLQSPDDVPSVVAGLKADVDLAADLGVAQLLTWEGRKPSDTPRSATHGWMLEATADIFDQALAYAAPKGVSIFVEVHPYTLGTDLEWLIKLCDRLDGERFGVLYDCCHFGVGLPDNYIGAIHQLAHRIKHVHFSDSDLTSSELHFAPGAGSLDLPGIIAALKQTGFAGSMMLDLWLYPFPEEGSLTGVPYVAQAVKQLGLK
jgi:sugar phosphate isomerase/epimerase